MIYFTQYIDYNKYSMCLEYLYLVANASLMKHFGTLCVFLHL